MSLSIKNPRVHELARAAAQATGRTQASVIEEALERYLAEVTSEQSRQRRDERADSLLNEIRRSIGPQASHLGAAIDDLYDESTGLPR